MVIYTIRCSCCETTRVGRMIDDDIVPFRSACPECGGEQYEVPAAGSTPE